MESSITFHFTRSKYLLDHWTLAASNIIACVSPMWFLVAFEIKPDILRGPTMQCQPSLLNMLTGFLSVLYPTEYHAIHPRN